MTAIRTWLSERDPAAPPHLLDCLDVSAAETGSPHDALAAAGLRALDRARVAPGRIRESAFELLAGDALLTYACESALEANAPNEALERWIEEAAAAR